MKHEKIRMTHQNVFFCRCSDETIRFSKASTLSRVFLGDRYPGVYLSRRESECVLHLLRGKKRRAIAACLQISVRTLDSYMESIKRKLECRHSREIAFRIGETDFAKNVSYFFVSRF